eukprot:scaffold209012_cov19-Tisochrysis_lutea.AAC.2
MTSQLKNCWLLFRRQRGWMIPSGRLPTDARNQPSAGRWVGASAFRTLVPDANQGRLNQGVEECFKCTYRTKGSL